MTIPALVMTGLFGCALAIIAIVSDWWDRDMGGGSA